jgi:hypothetical protein
MTFAVVQLHEGAETEMWPSDRHLYKTIDGRIVEDGHPDARFLFATPGYLIPKAQAVELGLVAPPVKETDVEVKARLTREDKMRTLRDAHQAEREQLAARQALERETLEKTGELPKVPEPGKEKAQPEKPQRSKPATVHTKERAPARS